MGTSVEQVERIEITSEHAAVTGTKSVHLLKWNNFGTLLMIAVSISTLLGYAFWLNGDWRGVHDDINMLKSTQIEMKGDVKDSDDNIRRLMFRYGIEPVKRTAIEAPR